MPRFPYEPLGNKLGRDLRNAWNKNLKDIEADIKELNGAQLEALEAADRANESADNADNATENAEEVIQRANDAAQNADEATENANSAAENANNESSNLEQLKQDVTTATEGANTAAQSANEATESANNAVQEAEEAARMANERGEYAREQGEYAKEQGQRVEGLIHDGAIPMAEKGIPGGVAVYNEDGKVVDAEGNEVEGKVKSVNGQIGEVAVTSEQVNYAGDDYDENKPMNEYPIGISLERMTLSSSNSFNGHDVGWLNVRTERNYTSSHGIQYATVYRGVNSDKIHHYVRESTGTSGNPNWGIWKQMLSEDVIFTDNAEIHGNVNGLLHDAFPDDLSERRFQNLGMAIDRVYRTGYLRSCKMYADKDGLQVKVGLTKQSLNNLPEAFLESKVVVLNQGWNDVELGFRVEEGEAYVIYANILQGTGNLGFYGSGTGWRTSEYNIQEDIRIRYSQYVSSATSTTGYYAFFEIEFVPLFSPLGIALTYKYGNPSIHIGEDAPSSTGIWLRPVGGTS